MARGDLQRVRPRRSGFGLRTSVRGLIFGIHTLRSRKQGGRVGRIVAALSISIPQANINGTSLGRNRLMESLSRNSSAVSVLVFLMLRTAIGAQLREDVNLVGLHVFKKTNHNVMHRLPVPISMIHLWVVKNVSQNALICQL